MATADTLDRRATRFMFADYLGFGLFCVVRLRIALSNAYPSVLTTEHEVTLR